jgi:hypothetical protein
LQHHPHVHCVIAAGGLAPDPSSWISSRRTFFLPVKVLGRVFRGKFVAGLKTAFHERKLEFPSHLIPLAEPRSFNTWLKLLFRHDWAVYAKRPFGGPENALRYLGAYTHRVGIANSRLVALSEGNVSFRWRDSAHRNKKRVMSLPVDEFLRRFLLHLLPRGFVRIRNFGFLANRQRATLLPHCFISTQYLKSPDYRRFRRARTAVEPYDSSNGSHRPNCWLDLHRAHKSVPHEPTPSAANRSRAGMHTRPAPAATFTALVCAWLHASTSFRSSYAAINTWRRSSLHT